MSNQDENYVPGSDVDFDALYRATYPKMLRSVGLMIGDWAEAEDCVQDAYVRAYQAWPRWHPDAPAEAWLWRITVNVAHTRIKQRQRRGISEILKRLGKPQEAPDPASVVFSKDLAAALSRLKPKEMSALVLRHLHGYSNIEIAHFLSVDVRTVTRLLGRASESVQNSLGDGWKSESTPAGIQR